ncbi:MAG TPA: ammonium transporter, partial [Acidimicrobiaceae bacterium]|nr:ammonium transporter [Acidimicrobiaceae bacterium]
MEGNTAWMLISTALVLFMVPGLALFYGGMVRSKNVLNMLNMNTYCLGIVPLVWVLVAFSLGNNGDGDGLEAFIGNLDALGLKDVKGTDALIAVAFSMTFAAITPALIAGAVADRMKFSAWAIFVPIWSLIVYTPVFYWVYVGWHHSKLDPAAIDFAGGTAIHINAGVAALALVMVLGKRAGWPDQAMPPHNLPFVMLGAGILWFGWFGFNGGSAFAADGVAAQAVLNTFVAGATGMVGWLAIEWKRDGHATTLGGAS